MSEPPKRPDLPELVTASVLIVVGLQLTVSGPLLLIEAPMVMVARRSRA